MIIKNVLLKHLHLGMIDVEVNRKEEGIVQQFLVPQLFNIFRIGHIRVAQMCKACVYDYPTRAGALEVSSYAQTVLQQIWKVTSRF